MWSLFLNKKINNKSIISSSSTSDFIVVVSGSWNTKNNVDYIYNIIQKCFGIDDNIIFFNYEIIILNFFNNSSYYFNSNEFKIYNFKNNFLLDIINEILLFYSFSIKISNIYLFTIVDYSQKIENQINFLDNILNNFKLNNKNDNLNCLNKNIKIELSGIWIKIFNNNNNCLKNICKNFYDLKKNENILPSCLSITLEEDYNNNNNNYSIFFDEVLAILQNLLSYNISENNLLKINNIECLYIYAPNAFFSSLNDEENFYSYFINIIKKPKILYLSNIWIFNNLNKLSLFNDDYKKNNILIELLKNIYNIIYENDDDNNNNKSIIYNNYYLNDNNNEIEYINISTKIVNDDDTIFLLKKLEENNINNNKNNFNFSKKYYFNELFWKKCLFIDIINYQFNIYYNSENNSYYYNNNNNKKKKKLSSSSSLLSKNSFFNKKYEINNINSNNPSLSPSSSLSTTTTIIITPPSPSSLSTTETTKTTQLSQSSLSKSTTTIITPLSPSSLSITTKTTTPPSSSSLSPYSQSSLTLSSINTISQQESLSLDNDLDNDLFHINIPSSSFNLKLLGNDVNDFFIFYINDDLLNPWDNKYHNIYNPYLYISSILNKLLFNNNIINRGNIFDICIYIYDTEKISFENNEYNKILYNLKNVLINKLFKTNSLFNKESLSSIIYLKVPYNITSFPHENIFYNENKKNVDININLDTLSFYDIKIKLLDFINKMNIYIQEKNVDFFETFKIEINFGFKYLSILKKNNDDDNLDGNDIMFEYIYKSFFNSNENNNNNNYLFELNFKDVDKKKNIIYDVISYLKNISTIIYFNHSIIIEYDVISYCYNNIINEFIKTFCFNLEYIKKISKNIENIKFFILLDEKNSTSLKNFDMKNDNKKYKNFIKNRNILLNNIFKIIFNSIENFECFKNTKIIDIKCNLFDSNNELFNYINNSGNQKNLLLLFNQKNKIINLSI